MVNHGEYHGVISNSFFGKTTAATSSLWLHKACFLVTTQGSEEGWHLADQGWQIVGAVLPDALADRHGNNQCHTNE
jgi:hypothetical protein